MGQEGLQALLSKTDNPSGEISPHKGETLVLLRQLPQLHTAALKLLASWLRAGKTALLPFFSSVCRLFQDIMLRVSIRTSDAQTPEGLRSEVRVSLFLPYYHSSIQDFTSSHITGGLPHLKCWEDMGKIEPTGKLGTALLCRAKVVLESISRCNPICICTSAVGEESGGKNGVTESAFVRPSGVPGVFGAAQLSWSWSGQGLAAACAGMCGGRVSLPATKRE